MKKRIPVVCICGVLVMVVHMALLPSWCLALCVWWVVNEPEGKSLVKRKEKRKKIGHTYRLTAITITLSGAGELVAVAVCPP